MSGLYWYIGGILTGTPLALSIFALTFSAKKGDDMMSNTK